MEIELKFLDASGTGITRKPLVYDGMIPLPVVSDVILLEGRQRKVKGRELLYLHGAEGFPDVHVTFMCEEVAG
jgi:hypothetical protein